MFKGLWCEEKLEQKSNKKQLFERENTGLGGK